MKERIICAAIKINDGKKYKNQPINVRKGFIITGRRHHDCYNTLSTIATAFFHDNKVVMDHTVEWIENNKRKHQGFITTKNRYVDRKEAWIIAQRENQIIYGPKNNSNDPEMNQLISENLYDDN